MTLSFGTRVSLNISQSGRVGVVTGNNIRSDGTMAYAVAWSDRHPGAAPGWYDAAELTVVPDDKPDVRALANEAGLMYPEGLDGAELTLWLFQCLRRAYDRLNAIDRLLPNQPYLESTGRIQGLIDAAASARQEVNVARARAEETRQELEARTLRVVTSLNPNGQDVVWGTVSADGSIAGVPRPHRVVPRDRDDVAVAYIIGPDPSTLSEKT